MQRLFTSCAAIAMVLALVPMPALAVYYDTSVVPLFIEPPKPAVPLRPVADAPPEANPPVVLSADAMGYDNGNAIVLARGNVELQQGGYILLAEQVTYFQNRDTVLAEGNVSITQPNGDVIFSDRLQLNDALKTGVIEAFKARMADNSVLVASRANRISPSNTTLTDVQYTPCNLCDGKAPFWQLNADEVKLDQINERMQYKGAQLEFGGVPVVYLPGMSHPTPDAEAKSGFLAPQYAANGNVGTVAKVPYYWRIDHDKEMILTPWYTTSEGPLLQGDYHQLRDSGEITVQATGSNPEWFGGTGADFSSSDNFRGHIFAKAYSNLAEYSRVGVDIQRASDDTFLRRYSFGDQRVLFSRAYAEYAERRNFAQLQGLSIQGLRITDDSKATPFVLPMLQGYYETAPTESGVRYHMFGDAQMLSREIGVDQQRLSATVGASLPYVTDGGHVLTSTVNLRQDMYQTSNVATFGGLEDYTNYRIIPQAALEWRYPLIQQFGSESMTIEPIMLGVLQSSGNNPHTISNEDSRLLELTDTNLFSLNRMPGLDAVDGGARLAYGARGQYLFSTGTAIDALIGQNYNPDKGSPFPNSTSTNKDFSDYIGRVAFNYSPVVLAYRFALDRTTFTPNRNEASFTYAQPWLSFTSSYRSIRNNQYLNDSREGDLIATLPVTDSWSVYGGARRNFELDQFVSSNLGLIFRNECFNLGMEMVRVYTSDRDVEPTTQFMLRIALKNLGEFGGQ